MKILAISGSLRAGSLLDERGIALDPELSATLRAAMAELAEAARHPPAKLG